MRLSSTFFVLLPCLLAAQTYTQLICQADGAPQLRRATMLYKAAQAQSDAARGDALPSLSAHLQGVKLRQTPTVRFHTDQGVSAPIPMATTRRFTGEVVLRYPIFEGFALDAHIEEKRYEAMRARLLVDDAKRNLYMRISETFGAIRVLKRTLQAQRRAKKAIEEAQRKAEAFYEKGLIAPSELYNIQARLYDTTANIQRTQHDIEKYLNALSYLTGKNVDDIHGNIGAPPPPPKRRLKTLAMRHRSDINALRALLRAKKSRARMAKSAFYPSVGFEAAWKRQGDTLALDGDGFSNADQSYVGVDLRWDLFNGKRDIHALEAARYDTLAASALLDDYTKRIAMEIDNAYLDLQSARAKRKSARQYLRAQREYYRLTKGRFEHQLADADELGRAVADLAAAKARLAAEEERIAVLEAKIWLLGGLETFKQALHASRKRTP